LLQKGKLTVETLQLIGASAVFLAIGGLLVFYEWSRTKAGRPILNGHQAVQLYYIGYLTMFLLAIVTAAKAIIG
jgi:hypothetical protein